MLVIYRQKIVRFYDQNLKKFAKHIHYRHYNIFHIFQITRFCLHIRTCKMFTLIVQYFILNQSHFFQFIHLFISIKIHGAGAGQITSKHILVLGKLLNGRLMTHSRKFYVDLHNCFVILDHLFLSKLEIICMILAFLFLCKIMCILYFSVTIPFGATVCISFRSRLLSVFVTPQVLRSLDSP